LYEYFKNHLYFRCFMHFVDANSYVAPVKIALCAA
jgi:hypothetical protein